MAIYEGSDCYSEFSTKGSSVCNTIQRLQQDGLTCYGNRHSVLVGLFGDMSFLMSVVGGASCGANNACIKCDVDNSHVLWTTQQFLDAGVPLPGLMTIKRRAMLAHALGTDYGLPEPYHCPGCGDYIMDHMQGEPRTDAQEVAYRKKHFSQKHGRPPLGDVALENIVPCSIHGEHNLIAQTWYATVTQNLWDKAEVDRIAHIVNSEWGFKRHTISKQSGSKVATKKGTPHFNGPEGKIVCSRRKRSLTSYTHQELWSAKKLTSCGRHKIDCSAYGAYLRRQIESSGRIWQQRQKLQLKTMCSIS